MQCLALGHWCLVLQGGIFFRLLNTTVEFKPVLVEHSYRFHKSHRQLHGVFWPFFVLQMTYYLWHSFLLYHAVFSVTMNPQVLPILIRPSTVVDGWVIHSFITNHTYWCFLHGTYQFCLMSPELVLYPFLLLTLTISARMPCLIF